MSKHNRTSRQRRIAVGLGATGGGLLAAAFIPVGIALADNTGTLVTTGGDVGLASGGDFETTPDPFNDFTGATESSPLSLFDQQINADNPALAAQLDYDINHGEPFSFASLDGIPAQTSAFTDSDTGTTDLDPFRDALGANPTTTEITNATSYDYALNQVLGSTETGHLDAIVDNPSTSVLIPPTVVPDNDPTADFVSLFDHNAISPTSGLPTDSLGTLAVDYDHFLNIFGLGAPLDSFEDLFTGSFTNPMTEALGGIGGSTGTGLFDGLGSLGGLFDGLGGTGTELATSAGTTGTDAAMNGLLDGLTSIL